MTRDQALGRDLISVRTREAVRDLMSGTTLREIDDMWQDELFPPAEDPEPVGGQRVTRFQGYLNEVDWTEAGQVARALRVFEVAIKYLFSSQDGYTYGTETTVPRLRRLFERDGYVIDDDGGITGGAPAVIAEGFLANLAEPQVIHEHVDRITNAIENGDPAQGIGSAKELIESTAKLVLRECGEPFGETEDLPRLVTKAQLALRVHPTSGVGGPDGTDAVKKILGAALCVRVS